MFPVDDGQYDARALPASASIMHSLVLCESLKTLRTTSSTDRSCTALGGSRKSISIPFSRLLEFFPFFNYCCYVVPHAQPQNNGFEFIYHVLIPALRLGLSNRLHWKRQGTREEWTPEGGAGEEAVHVRPSVRDRFSEEPLPFTDVHPAPVPIRYHGNLISSARRRP